MKAPDVAPVGSEDWKEYTQQVSVMTGETYPQAEEPETNLPENMASKGR